MEQGVMAHRAIHDGIAKKRRCILGQRTKNSISPRGFICSVDKSVLLSAPSVWQKSHQRCLLLLSHQHSMPAVGWNFSLWGGRVGVLRYFVCECLCHLLWTCPFLQCHTLSPKTRHCNGFCACFVTEAPGLFAGKFHSKKLFIFLLSASFQGHFFLELFL